jgi:putative addiction module component (TIGR02574 family)
MSAADIEAMTRAERLKTMELIWDSLIRDAESVESPAWHGEILKGRLEKIRKGESKFLDLDEVRQRLGRPAK